MRANIWYLTLPAFFFTLFTHQALISAQPLELELIIRFTPDVVYADQPSYVTQLSESAQTTLVYVKELSARRNTHLYRTPLLNDALTDDQIIKFLSQRGDVVYAEKNVTYQLNNK